MSKNVAYFEMTFEFLAEALRRTYGMPAEAVILDVDIDRNILYTPTRCVMRIQVEHPDLPEMVEGSQLLRVAPHIKFDWGIK